MTALSTPTVSPDFRSRAGRLLRALQAGLLACSLVACDALDSDGPPDATRTDAKAVDIERTAEPAAGPGNIAEPETGDARASVVALIRPAPDETLAVTPVTDEIYDISAPEDAEVAFDYKDLVLQYPDGGRIVFPEYLTLAEAGAAPSLRVGEAELDGDAFLGEAMLNTALYPPINAGESETPLIAGVAPESQLEPALGVPGPVLFFATARQGEGINPAEFRFTDRGAPEGRLSFGQLRTVVPESRSASATASPADWKTLDPENAAVTGASLPVEIDRMRRSFFGDLLASAAAPEILLFAHGPGLTFDQAAVQLATLARERGFEGTLMLYSWPAEGGDSQNTLIGRNVESVVDTIRARAPGATLHLLAHPALASTLHGRIGQPLSGSPDGGAPLYWRFGS